MSAWLTSFAGIARRSMAAHWLLVGALLYACGPAHDAPQFSYSLSEQGNQLSPVSPLALQVHGDSVDFAVAFKGGGGTYDSARLETDGNLLRVVLFDADGVQQKRLVLYHLSGTISGLEAKTYTLHISDLPGELIAGDQFSVR